MKSHIPPESGSMVMRVTICHSHRHKAGPHWLRGVATRKRPARLAGPGSDAGGGAAGDAGGGVWVQDICPR